MGLWLVTGVQSSRKFGVTDGVPRPRLLSSITAHYWHSDSAKMDDTFKGKRISATEIRPFVFAPIALTDDPDEAVQDERVIQGLGTIRLNFHRVVRQGVDKRRRSEFSDSPAQQVHRAAPPAFDVIASGCLTFAACPVS